MLKAFEVNEIKYCHWKSNEHLEPALNGDTDLDMLFLPEQRSEIDKVLNTCGLKRFRATPLMQYNAIEDYIGFDKRTAKIWHLHTHYRMTLGEKHLKGYTITQWGCYLLDNRIWSEMGIYTSCYEDELILLLVRNSMKLRWRDIVHRIGADDVRELTWLIQRIDKEKLALHAHQYLKDEAAKEIIKLSSEKLIKKFQLNHLHSILRDEIRMYTGYSRLGSWSARSIREIYWFIGAVIRHVGIDSNKSRRRVSPSGGCAIAFLGCDGAGKSTTIAYIKKEFSKKIDVKVIYLGSGDGSSSLLRKPMKLVAHKVGGKGVGHAVEMEYAQSKEARKRVSIKARLYSIAKVIWADTLANEKKNKLRQITKARNNGMLVLIDRYPQTEIMGYSDGPLLSNYLKNGHGFLYKKAKKELEIYRSANINPPDLTIKLLVPTEVAIERKPEMTVEEINNKKMAVLKMNPSKRIVEVDTSVDINESCGNAMNEIWKII
jgi:hypothetical protein